MITRVEVVPLLSLWLSFTPRHFWTVFLITPRFTPSTWQTTKSGRVQSSCSLGPGSDGPSSDPRSARTTWPETHWPRARQGARSIQPKFPEISVQNSMDRFGPTGNVSKKRVHLLRWTTFPGRTGWNFDWMDCAQGLKKQDAIGAYAWPSCYLLREDFLCQARVAFSTLLIVMVSAVANFQSFSFSLKISLP